MPGDLQDPFKVPAPRIGARMVKHGDDIYIHNGHDADNQKLQDMWKFNEQSNKWIEVQQYGEVPQGRNGHVFQLYGDYIILFGGILDLTKESDAIYIFHIPT